MCIKCIIDGDKIQAAGIHLAESAKGWVHTIDAMQDKRLCPVPLTDEEMSTVVSTSQEWCDAADEINDLIRRTNDKLCTIAVAHSHPYVKLPHQ